MHFTKLCALLGLVSSAPTNLSDWAVHTPPTSGRFFYASLKDKNVQTRVSNEEENFALRVNTWTSSIQMFSQRHSRAACQVPKYYDESLFKSGVSTN